jgi:hypothetical protein
MTPISFTATYKDRINISYRNRSNEIKDKEVSLVEMDKTVDRDAVFKTACLWQIDNNTRNYSWYILSAMERDKEPEVESEHFLAVTTQKDNFENLDYKKVLGMVMVSEEEDCSVIDWMQVKPGYAFFDNKNSRKYFHVGKAMRNYVQQNYSALPLYVYPAIGIEDFYIQGGFAQDTSEPQRMIYNV